MRGKKWKKKKNEESKEKKEEEHCGHFTVNQASRSVCEKKSARAFVPNLNSQLFLQTNV